VVPLDTLLQDVEVPHVEFVLEEVDVVPWVVALGGFALEVRLAGEVDDVDEHVGLVEVRQELVAQALAFVGTRDEAGDVDEFRRDESHTLTAVAVIRGT
jgi:hypothetical protein